NGHGQDDSENAEKAAADHQSDQHPHWMEIEASSEEFGRQVISFDVLNDDENNDDAQYASHSSSIQGHERKRKSQPSKSAQVGNEVEQSRKQADREGERHARYRKPDHVQDSHHQRDHQLVSHI